MKLVIHTQYLENYGTNEEPHWKPKGGFTYELPVNSVEEANQLTPELMQLIEYKDDHQEEYILGTDIVGLLEKTTEDWESVHYIMPSGSSESGWSVHYEYKTYSDDYICAVCDYNLEVGGGRSGGAIRYIRKDGKICNWKGEETGRSLSVGQLQDYTKKFSEVA